MWSVVLKTLEQAKRRRSIVDIIMIDVSIPSESHAGLVLVVNSSSFEGTTNKVMNYLWVQISRSMIIHID